ncbi:hypothetical protein DID77_04260 [Candidatus Marinamargulisbacteria bacterium SCGC AG-439-L15]|nr:hypothetical protein DID77_04260 [Candidatus Marinamargulisbacteria bacterium SCGC AG-439-L15]
MTLDIKPCEIYGSYTEEEPKRPFLSQITLDFSPIDFISHWGRCGITANFLAQFQAENFENKTISSNQFSTIFNELIENAVKFSHHNAKKIYINIKNYGDKIYIEIENETTLKNVEAFSKNLETLFSNDPETLFINKILENAEQKEASQLGLITIIKDFNAKIGVKTAPIEYGKIYSVCVKVILDSEEIESK